jgi:hypothetical protein
MANFVYTRAKKLTVDGGLNWGTNDIRALFVMTNSTADTQEDTTTISGFTTLDEFDGPSYGRKNLSIVTAESTGNNTASASISTITWPSLGVGSRSVKGLLIFKFVSGDSTNVPLLWIDTGGFPITPENTDVIVSFTTALLIN